MTEKTKSRQHPAKGKAGAAPPGQDAEQSSSAEPSSQLEAEPLATAKDIKRPTTSLPTSPKRDVAGLSVSLLSNISLGPSLDEIDKVNLRGDKETRTPIATVIEAVLGAHGGTMRLGELAREVAKHWNRPLPGGPYSADEFIYLVVKDSDRVRIDG